MLTDILVFLTGAQSAHAQALPVATSTLETFLGTTFNLGFETIIYALGAIWPFLVVVGLLWLFWKVGRSFFRR